MENYQESERRIPKEEGHKVLLAKWLRVLYAAAIAALVMIPLALVPALDGIAPWISRVISVVVLVALYQLSPVNGRYLKAAGYYLAGFLGGILQVFLGSNLLTTAAGICGIIAIYQEYTAHSELLMEMDSALSGKWHSLFYWELVIGLVGGVISVAGVVAGVTAGLEESLIIILAVAVVALIDVPIKLIYLRYLKKMMAFCFSET